MKKRICIKSVFFILALFTTDVLAEEAKVTVISKFSATSNPGAARNDSVYPDRVSVIKIEDQKNGVVCYGLSSESHAGRSVSGGYPGTSISCVQTMQPKKNK